ncbi:hypothetical protein RAG73_21875 [Klebsiella pneumoniae]|jgi:hypothetical protein|nr:MULTISPECIES: hypothetical protein [Enterobacteriaceae]HBQ5691443.1 hypothetical protein [Klebsiella pneumoniae subsp. pneumoniae]EFD5279856.1 hypothetical protein [Escherichia coli]EFH4829475.1 hypothetical protein [Escherichia coli]EFH9166811.1 hypothetical protein [Escherichia coli]EFH9185243.1 hypothetical protein [Escherichia coli]
MFKKSLLCLAMCFLSGCSKQAAPNYFNGNYYMAGDESCTHIRQIGYGRVMCSNDEGIETGYRDAMTQADMNYYQMQQMNQQMQMAQLNQQLQQTGQSFQNAGQQMLQQSQSYTAPQVQSYGSSGSTTYTQVGNNIIGSDGTSCTYVGQSLICR